MSAPAPALQKIDSRKKELPRYLVNGDTTLIEIEYKGQPYIWKIPTEWLPTALALAPLHLRKGGKHLYVAIKETKTQTPIQIHRVFAGVTVIDVNSRKILSNEREMVVVPWNGDILDYCNDNLKVSCVGADIPEKRLRNLDKYSDRLSTNERLVDSGATKKSAANGMDDELDIVVMSPRRSKAGKKSKSKGESRPLVLYTTDLPTKPHSQKHWYPSVKPRDWQFGW